MAPGVRVRLKLTSTVTLPVQGTQKRLLLNGYVQRLTFPAAIGITNVQLCVQDLPAAEPALQGDASPSQLARPTKRCRKANPPPAALDVPLEPDQAMEVQPTPLQPVKPAKVDQHPGDSNSNEATNTEQILYPPQSVSPTEVSAQPSLPKAILRSAPALPLPAPRAPSLPPMLRGVSTAAQAGPSTLLPPCLLHLQGANDSLSSAFNSLGPNDLLLPNSVCCPTGQQGSQTHLDWLISAARARKREGDALRGSGPWHMPSVSSMVEASLMFMEACDEKLRCPPSSQDRLQRQVCLGVALLYQQTSSLLQWTSRACETMQSREAVKEALRILCERLTMTCLLREAQLTHGSLRQYADKVDLLVKTQQQRSQQPGTTAAALPQTAAKQVPCTGTQPSAAAAAAAAVANPSQTAVVAAPAPRLQFPRRTAQPAVPVQASQQLAQQRPDSQQLRQNGPHRVSPAAVEQAASKATQQAQQAASKAAASKAAAAAQQAASKAAAAAQQQAQLSPVDSVTSCQEQVALAQSAAPMPRPVQINVSAELGAFQGKLLQSGRSVAKYAELLRKSTLGFQALLERPDIRASQAAKSACMHMAALCMDMGMGPPSRVVAHARLALNSLKQMATQS
ncbi:hypothetical protein QJQ45_002944 [Haematococcus lacustris]|nr:hypothetical protein QJQ45_002944 [Haematococcus lacustris]